MSPIEVASKEERGFVERRDPYRGPAIPPVERRQFSNSHLDLTADARELAQAIDSYKLHHRRRFISYEEILSIVKQLGYDRP